MKILKKECALLIMKLVSVLFLISMLFKGVSLVISEEEYIEEIEIKEDNSCTKYVVFHFCAFTLGAFWNVKRLLKVGIV
jgi:hypothetical protein